MVREGRISKECFFLSISLWDADWLLIGIYVPTAAGVTPCGKERLIIFCGFSCSLWALMGATLLDAAESFLTLLRLPLVMRFCFVAGPEL